MNAGRRRALQQYKQNDYIWSKMANRMQRQEESKGLEVDTEEYLGKLPEEEGGGEVDPLHDLEIKAKMEEGEFDNDKLSFNEADPVEFERR